jgi:hypothetical protein
LQMVRVPSAVFLCPCVSRRRGEDTESPRNMEQEQ